MQVLEFFLSEFEIIDLIDFLPKPSLIIKNDIFLNIIQLDIYDKEKNYCKKRIRPPNWQLYNFILTFRIKSINLTDYKTSRRNKTKKNWRKKMNKTLVKLDIRQMSITFK